MKTEKFSFKSYKRYYTYLPSLLKTKRIKSYFYLIMTFMTSAFFALTAIKPTINTIVNLNRKIIDGQEANRILGEKINALSRGQQFLSEYAIDLPMVEEAMPPSPSLDLLVRQIENLASSSSVVITSLNFESLSLRKPAEKKVINSAVKLNSVNFSFSVEGSYKNIVNFLESSHRLRRFLTLENIQLKKASEKEDEKVLLLSAAVKAYYEE